MSRILVLCVDRDDDLGAKAKIKGPVIGRAKNIKAAHELIMADPAEVDANTIFEAVRILDTLKKDAVDVVTLTGHPSRGYKADKRVSNQLEAVLKKYKNIDGVFLVTDGADDDEIIPVIRSHVKIVSKKMLVVKQAKELEKSYYVLKQVLADPHFARIIFGLPGIILLIIAFFQQLGVQIIVFAIGFYLIIKGFGVEEPVINAFRGFRETTSISGASFPIYISSFLTFILSIWAGFEGVVKVEEANIIVQGAGFVNGFVNLFVVAAMLFFVARIGDMHFRKEPLQIKRNLLSIVSFIGFWIVVLKVTDLIFGTIQLDEFIGWVAIAFIITVVGISGVRRFYLNKYVIQNLKKNLDVFDTEGNILGKISEVNKKSRYIKATLKKKSLKIPFSKIVLVKDYVAVRKT